jgi:putative copper export protein/mono/diheme cytochrome c family protein
VDWFFLVAARTVQFAATIQLFGGFAFACLIASPAFAARNSDAGPVASPRLARRLAALAWASLVLALLSGAAWLAAVAATMSGQPLAAALAQGVWEIVLTRTQFGTDWLLRLGFAGLIAVCLLLGPGRARRRGASAHAAASWSGLLLAAALLAALAWAGHGAATPGAPGDLHLVADMLHLLGAGFWLGMLLPLALLLVEARRRGDAVWARIAGAATRRFSLLAIAGVLMLLAGGIVNTWFLAGSVPALVGTEYGRLLLAKIGLFLATLVIAAVNLLRLTPRLAEPAARAGGGALWRAALWLRRNALAEASLGLAVLAIVGALGILPPGAHSEPGWPLPFRVDVATLSPGARLLLAVLGVLSGVAAVALVASAAAGSYRRAGLLAAVLLLCIGAGWLPLRPAIERAYPTSFYAPAVPYAAPSIVNGAVLYANNCALCHGANGEGDGPAAAALPVRPANLTEAHLFAHSPGDLFWWVSRGRDNGVMPGFAAVMTPNQRWDVINFIRARAAGVLARGIGPQIAPAAVSAALPDFAFERNGIQGTLSQMLKTGPVLLVLFAPGAPMARLAVLSEAQPRLAADGLQVIAVAAVRPSVDPPVVVQVAAEIVPTLALFRAPNDGGETDLLLDRNGDIRAHWTAAGETAGLPDAATLVADARRAAAIPVAAPSHAGHAQ